MANFNDKVEDLYMQMEYNEEMGEISDDGNNGNH